MAGESALAMPWDGARTVCTKVKCLGRRPRGQERRPKDAIRVQTEDPWVAQGGDVDPLVLSMLYCNSIFILYSLGDAATTAHPGRRRRDMLLVRCVPQWAGSE